MEQHVQAPAFYSVHDLQQLMGIGRNSAYKLVNSKGFPAILVGSRIIIPGDLFNQWVSKQSGFTKGMVTGAK